MPKKIVNKPYISKWIGGMYITLSILVISVFLGISLFTLIYSSSMPSQVITIAVMSFTTILLIATTLSLYRTKYVVKDGILTSWSPFAIIRLKLKDIKKVERTLTPFYFRVGASFYSGRFYIPSLGWTRTIITNLRDGLIITAKGGRHYLITPSHPERFMKVLKR